MPFSIDKTAFRSPEIPAAGSEWPTLLLIYFGYVSCSSEPTNKFQMDFERTITNRANDEWLVHCTRCGEDGTGSADFGRIACLCSRSMALG